MKRPQLALLSRVAIAIWSSEESHVNAMASRLLGNKRRALYWRAREAVLYDRALRSVDESKEK